MKKGIYLVLLFSLLGCVNIQRHPWTEADKAMFAAACAANAYDAYTTNKLIDNGGYIESPWQILYGGDDRPSTGVLLISKAAQLGLAALILDYVPSEYRLTILGIITGVWIYYGSTNE